MKAYTDIEQSRKLADFLPIESADMSWTPFDEKWDAYLGAPNPDAIKKEIPCWSLAALLGQMICPKLENYVRNKWDLDVAMDDTLQRWLSVQDCPTAIDACVEMLTKLHKYKLL